MNISPYSFADGIYYRLGKRINKKELGIILVSCKTLLTAFENKKWKDYEVWAFIDTLIYEMKKNSFPCSFRMFYTLANSFINCPIYNDYSENTNTKYEQWIRDEIERLKTS